MQRQEDAQMRVRRTKMREHGNEDERERRDEDEGKTGRRDEGKTRRREDRTKG
ncbi:hypothetical protein C1H46_044167 [Malus baccata]|uniref:Uncharacterized protein n=1 Tax=Malus baccata TaxID=106549 RepID=A0A540K7Y5_MALBA|nr:hypothetical protein C1H46_044167 [Malus baccata]